MLDNLSQKVSGVIKALSGNAKITQSNIEDAIREVRIALLEADVALNIVKDFIEEVKVEALGQKVLSSLSPDQAFISIVRDQLTKLLGQENHDLNLSAAAPAVVLMAGLQGAGKTTTTIKIAKRLASDKKVMVVSTDIYRPAAITQLEVLANDIKVECFASNISQKPLDIARNALDHARRHYFDVLIIDTAGRLAVDDAMMQEIKEIHQHVNPVEVLFVADAMLGQDAVKTAGIFNDALKLTGVVLTKMDGDSKGGAALSIKKAIGCPVKFIGTSEKMDGLESFYPDRIASRILGMGDILSLIDTVKSKAKEEDNKRLINKIKKGKRFDLEDFKLQIVQMNNMGGLSHLLDKLPMQLKSQAMGIINEKSIKKYIAMIDSMTIKERQNPDILKATRKLRIAGGSGTSVQEINQMLKQFEQISTMAKKVGTGGIGKMMQQFKHLLPNM